MNGVKISVVIPTFNRPLLLNRAIMSVLKQEFEQAFLEIIVVDDCSEMSPDISKFDGMHVRLIKKDHNEGPQLARNIGINQAHGDWIVMLDDDDELAPGALEKAMSKISQVDDHQNYPVFFFATSNGHIPKPFMSIGPAEIMSGDLYGDFTPVLNRALFIENSLSYLDFPQIHGVGCEQLTWLDISSRFSIPSFMAVLVKVNNDAPMRLTSYSNFLRNSRKFAVQQDITIDFVKSRNLHKLAPGFVEKKRLGAAIYYLVSGNKAECRERLKSIGKRANGVSKLMSVLSYFPVFIPRFLFLGYKRAFSR